MHYHPLCRIFYGNSNYELSYIGTISRCRYCSSIVLELQPDVMKVLDVSLVNGAEIFARYFVPKSQGAGAKTSESKPTR